MTISTNATVNVSMNGAVKISTADAILIVATGIAGAAAGSAVSNGFWIATPLMVGMLLVASARLKTAGVARAGGLPADVDAAVSAALAQLGEGQPRQLLAAVLQPARAILSAGDSNFDAQRDAETHGHVRDLLVDSCALALDLAHLAAAAPSNDLSNAELAKRHQAACDLLIGRLKDAASALSTLYASGIENGTPASDRVADLVSELRAEASARSAAKGELNELLGVVQPRPSVSG